MLILTLVVATSAGMGLGLREDRGIASVRAAGISGLVAFICYLVLGSAAGLPVILAFLVAIGSGAGAVFALGPTIYSDESTAMTPKGGSRERSTVQQGGAKASPTSGPIDMSTTISATHFQPGPTLEDIEEEALRRAGRDRSTIDSDLFRSRLRLVLGQVVMNMASNPNAGGTPAQQRDLQAVLDRPDFSIELLRRQLSHLGTSGAAAWRVLGHTDFERITVALAASAEHGTFDIVDERTATAAAAMGISRQDVDLVRVEVSDDLDDTKLTLAAIMHESGLGIGLWAAGPYHQLLQTFAQHVPTADGEVKGVPGGGFVLVPARGVGLVVAAFEGARESCLLVIPASQNDRWMAMFSDLTKHLKDSGISGMTITTGYTQRALAELFIESQCVEGTRLKSDLDALAAVQM